MVTLNINAEIQELAKINDVIMESEIPKAIKYKLCLACEEWFVNICSYGYQGTDIKDKKVEFTFDATDRVTIRFADNGKEYNPLNKIITVDEYDYEHQIGGLGKLIMKSIADDINYEYKDNKNILTMVKYLNEK